MRDFITCLEFLTRLRFTNRTEWHDDDFSRSVPYFPLVGLVMGLFMGAVNYGLYPECRDYMLCSHLSSDISAKAMLELMELVPIVDAGLRLGEGTGASLAIVVLQSALDVYNQLHK